MDTLIITAALSEPPTQVLPFRLLGIKAKLDLHLTVVLESPKDMIDIYYHFLKPQGIFDFLYQIVVPEDHVDGIRLDTEYNYPHTVKVDRVVFENMENILEQIKIIHGPDESDKFKDELLKSFITRGRFI